MSASKKHDHQPVLKLQYKLFLVVAAIITVMGIVMLVFMSTLSEALHDEHRNRGLALGQSIASNSIDPILTDNMVALQTLLTNVKENEPEVVYAFVLDPAGKLLAHTFENGFPQSLFQATRPSLFPPNSEQNFATEEGGICDAAVSIMKGELGIVHVGLSDSFINAKITEVRRNIITATIIIFLLSFLAAYILSSLITRPLKMLSLAAEDIGRGNLDHQINISSHDEIGVLAKTFNQMTSDLNRQRLEQKKLEEEILQAHKMEAIGTLAGGVAHDFNNILAAILGYAEMARFTLLQGGKPIADLEQVIKSGHRAKDLVKQILTFSRKGQETLQVLLPFPIVKESLKFMHASLPKTVEIQEEIDPECGTIIADPTNIHQVLVNLCTNAFHAMEDEKGVLTVKLTRVELVEADVKYEAGVPPGSFVELMVSDTGLGMDKSTMERIFEPYFTTKDVDKGTGMGLALVHGIVHGCGGFIKVESELGKGTVFRVYFPVIEEQNVVVDEERHEPLPRGDERILAVDDEEVIARMYRATLEQLGYKVTTYSNSEEALEEFRAAPDGFDLVITDQTMPNIPGSELAKEMLQIRPDIPIIMYTGYSSIMSHEKAKEIGIVKFAMKPVHPRNLAKTVREILDKGKS